MMKTCKEWLEGFPEPWRSQALENAPLRVLDRSVESASRAVGGSFDWGHSPQGYAYWDEFHVKLCVAGNDGYMARKYGRAL